AEPERHWRVLAGLRRQVEKYIASGIALFFNFGKAGSQPLIKIRVADVTGYVEESLGERIPEVVVNASVLRALLNAFAHLVPKVIVGKFGTREPDDREAGRETPVVRQPVERGQ